MNQVASSERPDVSASEKPGKLAALARSVRSWFARPTDADLERRLDQLRRRVPAPVFWLFGKTQSGKTSIIRYLTGAEDAEIGAGFRPTTRFSREYAFPSPDTPLIRFLDTRGLGEPDYDPEEDITRFGSATHAMIVTVRAADHAKETVLRHLKHVRTRQPERPVILALTCLHDLHPQQQHPLPYPFGDDPEAFRIEDFAGQQTAVPEPLLRTIAEQKSRFRDLVDYAVPIDLTRPEDGYEVSDYGGSQLKKVLLHVLPIAYRQTLLQMDEAGRDLGQWYEQRALPYIIGYSTLAATAGAMPVPWLDLLLLPAIQSRMVFALARLYGQPLTATRFLELAGTLGVGLMVRQAVRETSKLIPGVGSVLSGALAGSTTFALGKAFCHYYQAVLGGHVPNAQDLRSYFRDQLAQAERLWRQRK